MFLKVQERYGQKYINLSAISYFEKTEYSFYVRMVDGSFLILSKESEADFMKLFKEGLVKGFWETPSDLKEKLANVLKEG